MKYLVLAHKSKYGFDIHVPALPGCHSQGETRAEAFANIKDAIIAYLTGDSGHTKGKTEIREIEISVT